MQRVCILTLIWSSFHERINFLNHDVTTHGSDSRTSNVTLKGLVKGQAILWMHVSVYVYIYIFGYLCAYINIHAIIYIFVYLNAAVPILLNFKLGSLNLAGHWLESVHYSCLSHSLFQCWSFKRGSSINLVVKTWSFKRSSSINLIVKTWSFKCGIYSNAAVHTLIRCTHWTMLQQNSSIISS